jgi:hypothetical protein
MPRLLLALAALILLALPSLANAQTQETNAPPGNSAIDEYLETVPNATGNARPRGPGGGVPPTSALTKQQRARLERLGPDGKALAHAVDATAPAVTSSPKNDAPPSAVGRSPLSEVLDAAAGRDGGGGMGIVLPAILLATLLCVIALVVARRRSLS